MKAIYVNIILLIAVGVGVFLYRFKFREGTSDFARLEAGLKDIGIFFHSGSRVVLKSDMPDGGSTGSFANYLIVPATLKKPGTGPDTTLVITTLTITDSATKAIVASGHTFWRYADDKYQMLLVYNQLN